MPSGFREGSVGELLRDWRFRPGEKDGKPVPIVAQVEVNFRLGAGPAKAK